jgi:hypothetical protein
MQSYLINCKSFRNLEVVQDIKPEHDSTICFTDESPMSQGTQK